MQSTMSRLAYILDSMNLALLPFLLPHTLVSMLQKKLRQARLLLSRLAPKKTNPSTPSPLESMTVATPISPAGLEQTLIALVGNDPYYVRRRVEISLPAWFPASHQVAPAVVLHHDVGNLSLAKVQNSFAQFLQTDDVFQQGFTHDAYLLVQTSKTAVGGFDKAEKPLFVADAHTDQRVAPDLADYLTTRSLVLCFIDYLPIPEGPYFVMDKEIHQAWRLFPDHLGAFATSVVPDDRAPMTDKGSKRFISLQSSAFTGADAAVAVPSRLYFPKTEEKPLNGRRISIKDNMHLSGVVTGLGNRAYAELYGKQAESSKLVDLLISQGATVVGKTKLSAFAGSEVPPCQCIDYFPPWNPRGDGYQGPSGSSSGAGASTAGYDWLDSSICTDTTGSMRWPASSHGVWGLKASWNSLPMEGTVPACGAYDSFGLLSRTTVPIYDLLDALGVTLRPNNWPTKILYPTDWFPVSNEAQQRMNEAFLEALEAFLGVKHTKFSIKDEWSRTAPEHLRNRTVLQVEDMAAALNGYDNYHNFDDFRSQYQERFKTPPYVSPSHTSRWDMDAGEKPDVRQRALEQVTAFKKWAFENILSVDENGDSSTIMLVPHGRPGANYRDAHPEPKKGNSTTPPNISSIYIASMLGVPQLLIPIGQNPYDSRVSRRKEFAPIFTTIVGAPGSDLTLVKIGQKTLEKAGWPTTVLTGRFMFEVGDTERNTLDPTESKL